MNKYCVPYVIGRVSGTNPDTAAKMVKAVHGETQPDEVRTVPLPTLVRILYLLGYKVEGIERVSGRTIKEFVEKLDDYQKAMKIIIVCRCSGTPHVLLTQFGLIEDNHTQGEMVKPDEYPFKRSKILSAFMVK